MIEVVFSGPPKNYVRFVDMETGETVDPMMVLYGIASKIMSIQVEVESNLKYTERKNFGALRNGVRTVIGQELFTRIYIDWI